MADLKVGVFNVLAGGMCACSQLYENSILKDETSRKHIFNVFKKIMGCEKKVDCLQHYSDVKDEKKTPTTTIEEIKKEQGYNLLRVLSGKNEINFEIEIKKLLVGNRGKNLKTYSQSFKGVGFGLYGGFNLGGNDKINLEVKTIFETENTILCHKGSHCPA